MPTTERPRAPRRTRARFLLPLAVVTLLGVTACGGDDEGAADDDVATLGDGSSGDDGSATEDEGEGSDGGGQGSREISPEFQDALLDFAACMREHGVDMPDPEVSEGGVAIAIGEPGSGPPSAAEQQDMEDAQEACQPIMDAVESELPRPDPEQVQEMQDQALEFARCMREHGIDMPDPQFDDQGRITQSIGGPDGPGFDDDDFQEAQEACSDGEGGPGIVVGGGPAGGSTSSGEGG